MYLSPKYGEEEFVPAFEATLLSGDTFRSSNLKGSFVLLHFWGSWCGPCRKENPEWVELYHQWNKVSKQKPDFEIVSVGIEQSRDVWIRAIQADNLDWPYQIGTFKRFKSPLAIQFGVREIPTTYLIDPDGKVVLVNGTPDEIARLLEQSTIRD